MRGRLAIPDDLSATVARALAEDVGSGDLTAQLITPSAFAVAQIITREECVLCGVAWCEETFRQVDSGIRISWNVQEGTKAGPDTILCKIEGSARGILTAERTAINFLQLLSGTATKARRYADVTAGMKCQVIDTRKTLPGLRSAQKYAVRIGGCGNHRLGLYDAVLIKENHLKAIGSISQAIKMADSRFKGVPIEVEVENLDQLAEALEAGAHHIMLDNFAIKDMKSAVEITKDQATLEISGNVDIDGVYEIARTGVDYISVGALTKNVSAIDLSLLFEA